MLGFFVVILLAFFFTFSRVAIGVWGLASIWFCIRYWADTRKLFLVTAITSVSFAFFFWPQVQTRLQLHAQDEAIAQRIFYAKISGSTSRDHPVLGVGIGQFVPVLMKNLPRYPAYAYQPAHSIYLLAVTEIGALGALALLAIIGSSFWAAWQNDRRLIPILIAFFILGIFDHYFWTLQQGGLMWWGLLGFASRAKLAVS